MAIAPLALRQPSVAISGRPPVDPPQLDARGQEKLRDILSDGIDSTELADARRMLQAPQHSADYALARNILSEHYGQILPAAVADALLRDGTDPEFMASARRTSQQFANAARDGSLADSAVLRRLGGDDGLEAAGFIFERLPTPERNARMREIARAVADSSATLRMNRPFVEQLALATDARTAQVLRDRYPADGSSTAALV